LFLGFDIISSPQESCLNNFVNFLFIEIEEKYQSK
jgi:hypothetical protein